MLPLTIDFEASCLPRHGRSYPIEVGVSDMAGRARSWLIRPLDAWRDWTWTEEAERLHGITRAQLDREGRPAHEVLAELCELAGPRDLIADSWLDAGWLAILGDAAGFAPGFGIRHVVTVLDVLRPSPADARAADARVAAVGVRRHRAAQDARYLALWLSALGIADEAAALVARRSGAASAFAWPLRDGRTEPGQAVPGSAAFTS